MRIRLLLAALTVVACAAACGGTDVVATTPSSSSHCVRGSDSGSGSASERCFDDYRTAISFATRGAITDAPLDAYRAPSDQHFKAEVLALHDRARTAVQSGGTRIVNVDDTQGSSVIGATVFTGTNFTGDSLTIIIPSPCVKNGLYDWESGLGDYSHRIQSVQPWANCWIWLHEGDTTDSARQGPYKTDTADLGDWKNRAVLVGLS